MKKIFIIMSIAALSIPALADLNVTCSLSYQDTRGNLFPVGEKENEQISQQVAGGFLIGSTQVSDKFGDLELVAVFRGAGQGELQLYSQNKLVSTATGSFQIGDQLSQSVGLDLIGFAVPEEISQQTGTSIKNVMAVCFRNNLK